METPRIEGASRPELLEILARTDDVISRIQIQREQLDILEKDTQSHREEIQRALGIVVLNDRRSHG
jgi:hypothetical protein